MTKLIEFLNTSIFHKQNRGREVGRGQEDEGEKRREKDERGIWGEGEKGKRRVRREQLNKEKMVEGK